MNSRYRIYAAAGLLGALFLSGGFLVLGRSQASTSSAVPVIKPLHPVRKQAREKAQAKANAVAKRKRARARKTRPSDGMPIAVSGGLAKHNVVVVSLVAPGAAVDQMALEEARAGAEAAGAGFVQILVSNNDDVQALTTLLGSSASPSDRLLDAPAVLVLHRPQTLFVRFNGFVDAATVAQAAHNAATAARAS